MAVEDDGLTPSYQWQFNQVDISTLDTGYSGVDTASLTIIVVEGSDAGMYRCVVTTTGGETNSVEAQLSVCESISYVVAYILAADFQIYSLMTTHCFSFY